MVISLQIMLLSLISIVGTVLQVNLIYAADNNSTNDGTSTKNIDVFALLQLERDVAEEEGSLQDLQSGNNDPFELLGEVKTDEKFKPESGSFLPEYDDTLEDNDN